MAEVCQMCNKTFSKKSNLVRHIARIHSEKTIKPSTCPSFICDNCDQSFSRKQNLKRHLLVHTPNDRCKIKCLYCISNGTIKKFVTRNLLIEHCVKVHNVEFQEEIKIFSSKSGMKNKLYTYTILV